MLFDRNNLPANLIQQAINMPKIELHVHIEGATQAETFYELAKKNKVDFGVESLEEWKSFFEFKDFGHFLQVYTKSITALKTPEDYTHIITEFYRQQAEQNIIYSEAYISASFIIQKFDTKEILDAIEKGIQQGSEKYKVKINFIPDISRELVDSQMAVAGFAIEGFNRGLFIGLGIGGPEQGFPPELFTEAFKKAKSNGLRLVAHAGETEGAKSIWGAINTLGAERIGHGVRSLEDPKLIQYLVDNKITLEVSPTSNYALGIIKNGDMHPIRQLLDAGVICTINSDDPAMFSTSLVQEYFLLLKQGFDCKELYKMNLQALKVSFACNETKAKITDQLENYEKNRILFEPKDK
ncbi:MAG: adenosine deaminase [Bacteroidales bacterium]|jgi:adenosine deaminase|nr:adenosine deaminase [Bacteroidales bacterium]